MAVMKCRLVNFSIQEYDIVNGFRNKDLDLLRK